MTHLPLLFMPRILLLALLVVLCVHEKTRAEDTIDFNRDIRPILSDNCFYCHGFDEEHREAGLRLDTFEAATDSDALVPGKPDESELLRRILVEDSDEKMPPPDTEKSLSEAEIDLIRRWISEGAPYKTHWAWTPLSETEASHPAHQLQDRESIVERATIIDDFLAKSWKENETAPVVIATPRERLRRLSFDLRGLAPSPTEIASFQKDPSNKRFAAFRQRWMSELSYAEHQAVRWLDLVRWADTSGFVSDEPIASGAYRAWVIRSIDKNVPFDQFSRDQLAGDLVAHPTDDQLIASGYNRIVNTNCEAGAIEKEQLYKLKGEHVRALGTVWLGMTTGCAECHDHKFDPFSAKDYYSLAAFFDDLVEAGVYTPGDRREPLHYVHPNRQLSSQDSELERQRKKSWNEIQSFPCDESSESFQTWQNKTLGALKDSKSRSQFTWIPARLPAMRHLKGHFTTGKDDRVYRETTVDSGLELHHAAELMSGYIEIKPVSTDPQKDAFFVDVRISAENPTKMIGFQVACGDYGRLGWQTANYETYYWGDDVDGTIGKSLAWSTPGRVKRMGDLPERGQWARLRVPFADRIAPVGGKAYEAVGMSWFHDDGTVRWGDSGFELRTDKVTGLKLGETAIRRWWERPKNRQIYQSRFAYVSKSLRKSAKDRDSLQQSVVVQAYREATCNEAMERLLEIESNLFQIRARAFPVLVSKQTNEPKQTRLLHRGDYQDTTGPIVTAAVPEFLGTLPENATADRLALANWLFTDAHHLVSRVYVNRLWHQFYGRGISESLEDSGTQGDWPSHPKLLDWLAAEFHRSGWDRNYMVRLLTSTRAYQLSSTPTKDLAQRDPSNRWHARQGRFRMNAEAIRDLTLQTAGLLRLAAEVPLHSFFPYQPDPYWTRSDKVMFGSRHMLWETSQEDRQYERSLYTFWKRQNIHPTMLAFDAPTRQECTAKRNITNTPGQALALLNDPIFVEAARVLAERLLLSKSQSDDERVTFAYRLVLQRDPTADEKHILLNLLKRQRDQFASNKDAASKLINVGQHLAPANIDKTELAAWTTLTRTLLNLHEFLNRT